MGCNAIIAWLRAHSIPLRYLRAGNGFEDLQRLKAVFADAVVIGMGEATHGTKEFVEVRHRLLEFLVVEVGFDALVIEASNSDMGPANEYVLHGTGDRSRILADCGTLMWDTREFSWVLDWLRDYNRAVDERRKVRLYGMDIWPNRLGRERVLRYLERVAPERATTAKELLESLAGQEARWPAIAADQKNEEVIKTLLPRLRALQACLAEAGETLVQKSSAGEYEEVQASLGQMERWMMANITEFVPPAFPAEQGPKNLVRSRYMAENVRGLLERSPSGSKFVVWAHNYHLEIGLETAAIVDIPNMGSYFKEWYGDRYYSLGLEFNRGGYLSREVLPGYTMGDFKVGTFDSSSEGSLPYLFAAAGLGNFIINLQAPTSNPAVRKWLLSRQRVHTVSWAYKEPERSYTEITPGKRRDGILFVENVAPTTPNASALEAAGGGGSEPPVTTPGDY